MRNSRYSGSETKKKISFLLRPRSKSVPPLPFGKLLPVRTNTNNTGDIITPNLSRLVRVSITLWNDSFIGWITLQYEPKTTVSNLRKRLIEKAKRKIKVPLTNFQFYTKEKKIHLPEERELLSFLEEIGEHPISDKPLSIIFIQKEGFNHLLKNQKSISVTEHEDADDNPGKYSTKKKTGNKRIKHKADPDLAFQSFNSNLQQKKKSKKLSDFLAIKVIGRGSFGEVLLVRDKALPPKDPKGIYAIKILFKEKIVKMNQVEHAKTECAVLASMNNPFIIKLHYAFQSKQQLFLVIQYCPGGELFFHLSKEGRFPEKKARFYAAEVLLALDALHQQNIIYRDLKPENVLLDAEGHVCLTDFGLSKRKVGEDHFSEHSVCGTPEYLAPEILGNIGHGKATDWWLYGSFVFELLTGHPPFHGSKSKKELYNRILTGRIHMPGYISKHAKSLLKETLKRNPKKRLGSLNDAEDIKKHPFFSTINWDALYRKQVTPPFQPVVSSFDDTCNFDEQFTNIPISEIFNRVSSKTGLEFSEFSYNGSTRFSFTPDKMQGESVTRNSLSIEGNNLYQTSPSDFPQIPPLYIPRTPTKSKSVK